METNAQISPSVPALVMLYISCYFILITNNLIKTITLYFHTVLLSLFFSCLFVLFFDFLEKKASVQFSFPESLFSLKYNTSNNHSEQNTNTQYTIVGHQLKNSFQKNSWWLKKNTT